MSAPSMVSRNGDNLIVRSVVSGDPLFGTLPPDLKDDQDDGFLSQPEPEEEYSPGELPQCKIKRNYSCPNCNYYTQNPRFYLYHQKHVHKERIKIYECPSCLYASKHSQKLQRHVHMVHVMGAGKKRAAAAATTSSSMKQQQQQRNRITAASLVVAANKSPIAAQLQQQQQHPMDIYEGEEASEPEPSYTEDGTQIYKCSVCGEICKSVNQLRRHERQIHLKRKFYRCAKCNYVTHMKARYTKHVKYHSMPMIKCDLCDFKTPYKWNLDRHNKNHMGDGAFKCSLCNFTADIKQSLTVHEMNHHVPPVGHLLSNNTTNASMNNNNRRRLRVGASDSLGLMTEEDQIERDELELLKMERESSFSEQANPADFVQAQLDIPPEYNHSDSNSSPPRQQQHQPSSSPPPQSMMINSNHPRISLVEDDRLITIKKYKCKMCEYEGNLGEVHRHETLMHNLSPLTIFKKKAPRRPIPNLIPIQGGGSGGGNGNNNGPPGNVNNQSLLLKQSLMDRKNIPLIVEQISMASSSAEAATAATIAPSSTKENVSNIISNLKDITAMIGGNQIDYNNKRSTENTNKSGEQFVKKLPDSFKKKNASFFDKLKEKLMTSASESNLTCSYCGYEAKCLSEHMKHQRSHMLGGNSGGGGGNSGGIVDSEESSRGSNSQHGDNNNGSLLVDQLSSTRCQHCRTRFKTNASLLQHLPNCIASQTNTSLLTQQQEQEILPASDDVTATIKIEDDDEEEVVGVSGGGGGGGDEEVEGEGGEADDEGVGDINHPEDQDDDDDDDDEDDDDDDDDDDLLGDHLNDNLDEFNPLENKVFIWNTLNGNENDKGFDENENGGGGDLKLYPEEGTAQEILDKSLLGVEVKPGYGIIARTLEEKHRSIGRDLSIKKVFKCPHCSFWASTASRFHVHIVGHLNKRPFQCSLCYYSSNWRWDITKHIRLKTLRDPTHGRAKVLLTDEAGRRNYSKYNKYLTTMRMELSAGQTSPEDSTMMMMGAVVGGGGGGSSTSAATSPKNLLSPRKLFSSNKENGQPQQQGRKRLAEFGDNNDDDDDANGNGANGNAEDGHDKDGGAKKRAHSENKRTMWKCKKCYFRDSDRSVVLAHVKEHYRQAGHLGGKKKLPTTMTNSVRNQPQSPSTTTKFSMTDIGENEECPDFMCETCPFIGGTLEELETHCERHFVSSNTTHKCQFCPYYACNKKELLEHYDMHSEAEAEDSEANKGVIYACFACPYVATSHAQLIYHRNWHRPDNIAATHGCIRCTYGAPNNMLLSLHVRLHGRNNLDNLDTYNCNNSNNSSNSVTIKRKQQSAAAAAAAAAAAIGEKKPADISGVDTNNYTEIPMVWVSKPMGISKMYKCRYCPHVNMRKSNIQEHEKMHGLRELIGGNNNQTAHQCSECNYVCNNPGVLSSHAKVHAAFFGTVVGIVDSTRSDEIQIDEMREKIVQLEECYPSNNGGVVGSGDQSIRIDENTTDSSSLNTTGNASDISNNLNNNNNSDEDRILHFCNLCPARFLMAKEIAIHTRFHQLELPFKCESCTYTARQRQHLMAHSKVHSDEYQERTNTLLNTYTISEENPRPKVAVILDDERTKAESMWIVVKTNNNNNDNDNIPTIINNNNNNQTSDNNIPKNNNNHSQSQAKFTCTKCPAVFSKSVALQYHTSLHGGPGPHKCRVCDYAVKTYGNLTRHETIHQGERRQQQRNDSDKQKTTLKNSAQPLHLQRDPEFGLLIHGSPDFVYPTYLKNGKLKEKRYKCHKCPSAFEKREQYKVHLSLHGSKQRYNCERCDYSVKYYANYSQHVKKHEVNDASRKEMKVSNGGIIMNNGNSFEWNNDDEMANTNININTININGVANNNEWNFNDNKSRPIPLISRAGKSLKMSIADQQSFMVMQQRFVSNSVIDKEAAVSRCTYCPYANNRRDGVTGHIRCHINNKGAAYSCKYCQYNVPQLHRLREHLKMHFAPIKFMKPEAYMKVDRLELYAEPTDPNHNSSDKKQLIFKDNGETFPKKARYEPEVLLQENQMMINFITNNNNNNNVEEKQSTSTSSSPPSLSPQHRGRIYINLKTGAEEIELDEDEDDEQEKESGGSGGGGDGGGGGGTDEREEIKDVEMSTTNIEVEQNDGDESIKQIADDGELDSTLVGHEANDDVDDNDDVDNNSTKDIVDVDDEKIKTIEDADDLMDNDNVVEQEQKSEQQQQIDDDDDDNKMDIDTNETAVDDLSDKTSSSNSLINNLVINNDDQASF